MKAARVPMMQISERLGRLLRSGTSTSSTIWKAASLAFSSMRVLSYWERRKA